MRRKQAESKTDDIVEDTIIVEAVNKVVNNDETNEETTEIERYVTEKQLNNLLSQHNVRLEIVEDTTIVEEPSVNKVVNNDETNEETTEIERYVTEKQLNNLLSQHNVRLKTNHKSKYKLQIYRRNVCEKLLK